MTICVSAKSPEMGSDVDPRFGRAAAFCICDTETGEIEGLENGAGAPSGAGVQTAQWIIDRGVEAVITGSVGPNAFRVLRAAGVAVYVGASGTVESAIEDFRAGKLTPTTEPTNAGHQR